ncbi:MULTISPECIES: hypothetical protein [Acinetobacter]|uniref:Uncharacterized protein n=1 Tax=Acinetobacter corruptisaponis TaxID=3045147 RepID=A0ABY8SAG5_9GAMM|nr:hypothetical protein [Acinetobacter sp. KCTC 92772]WHP07507.1 hypothetical protein QLH32_08690 [Acinetobacter sp. KCTC 92772]
MRYTPIEILKDEAQALFQFEQEMVKQIFDENILSTIDQELVDQKSLYRAIEVMQESILKPKELRKLFGEMDTQNDETVFTNLDQFTDKFGNYIDALSPIFSILKNIYSVDVSDQSEVGDSSDNKEISILKEEIIAIDKDISVLKTARDRDLANIESEDYAYKIDEIKMSKIKDDEVESIRKEGDVRGFFEEFLQNDFEDTFSVLDSRMEDIDSMIKEIKKIVKIEKLENLSLENIGDNKIGLNLDVIYNLGSIISTADNVFLRAAEMCCTLRGADVLLITVENGFEMMQEVGELLKDNFDNLGIDEFTGFQGLGFLNNAINHYLQKLFDKLDKKKWSKILVNLKFYQDLSELIDDKNEKQDEIKELQKSTTNASSKPQKKNEVENHAFQDFSLSLEKMKERNKALKQCVEKYI